VKPLPFKAKAALNSLQAVSPYRSNGLARSFQMRAFVSKLKKTPEG
jgi:hypothetical protein